MKANIQRILEISHKDPLTNLYNRRFFFESAYKMLASAKRQQISLSVGMLDIDFFKKVNDTYGHDIGDEVIKHLSATLQSRFRETDVVSRFGGEEFCVLTVNMDNDHVFHIYDELRKKIEETELSLNGQTVRYTVSIGVCCHAMDSIEAMIKQADLMLYEAKESGRNKVVLNSEP